MSWICSLCDYENLVCLNISGCNLGNELSIIMEHIIDNNHIVNLDISSISWKTTVCWFFEVYNNK